MRCWDWTGIPILADEADAYNSEINEVNTIRETVISELRLMAKDGYQPTVQDSKRLWEKYSDTVSPETVRVVRKLSTALVRAAH